MVKPYFVFHQLVIVSNSNGVNSNWNDSFFSGMLYRVSNSNGVNSNIKIGTKKRAKILFQTPTE